VRIRRSATWSALRSRARTSPPNASKRYALTPGARAGAPDYAGFPFVDVGIDNERETDGNGSTVSNVALQRPALRPRRSRRGAGRVRAAGEARSGSSALGVSARSEIREARSRMAWSRASPRPPAARWFRGVGKSCRTRSRRYNYMFVGAADLLAAKLRRARGATHLVRSSATIGWRAPISSARSAGSSRRRRSKP
jgi:hypothetical protein